MFIDNKNFYPTSPKMVELMLKKVIEIRAIKYILEPSCGKGNIIDSFREYYNKQFSSSYYSSKDADKDLLFDVIELDENLSNMLRGQGLNVIWDDFLTFEPQRFYDLIIMNPPFDKGCDHLLKAISVQERIGGQIVCLLNAETLKNPYSNNRKQLLQLIEKYNGDVEYIQNAFSDAERQTDVETALIFINVPMTNNETIFEKHFKRDNEDLHIDNLQSLVPNMNKLEKLVFEADLIKKSTIELFKEQMKINNLLEGFGLKSIVRICDDKVHPDIFSVNSFINKINMSYWNKFIEETDFKSKLPSKLRDNFTYNMEKQENITFNIQNVRYFYEELIQAIPKSYEETVAKVFDDITSKAYYSDKDWNKTIHLYNGWKTNSCYKINNKSIISDWTGYYSNFPSILNDLNIIFSNISGIKYNINNDEVRDAIKRCEKNIETEFFILDCYKKGTIHIKYKNQEYLNQFNILAGKGKNALPPDFGQKKYSDMNEEEKNLVKEFGLNVQEYDNLTINSNNNYLRIG